MENVHSFLLSLSISLRLGRGSSGNDRASSSDGGRSGSGSYGRSSRDGCGNSARGSGSDARSTGCGSGGGRGSTRSSRASGGGSGGSSARGHVAAHHGRVASSGSKVAELEVTKSLEESNTLLLVGEACVGEENSDTAVSDRSSGGEVGVVELENGRVVGELETANASEAIDSDGCSVVPVPDGGSRGLVGGDVDENLGDWEAHQVEGVGSTHGVSTLRLGNVGEDGGSGEFTGSLGKLGDGDAVKGLVDLGVGEEGSSRAWVGGVSLVPDGTGTGGGGSSG